MTRQARNWSGRAVLLAALILAPALRAHAAEDAGRPGEWLEQYRTARSLGLGGAYVAAPSDPLGALWNPRGSRSSTGTRWDSRTPGSSRRPRSNAFSLAVPGSRLPSFGFSLVALRSGGFERTNEMNDALGSFRHGRDGIPADGGARGHAPARPGANLKWRSRPSRSPTALASAATWAAS